MTTTPRFRLMVLTLTASCCLAMPAWAGPGDADRSQATTQDVAELVETLTRAVLPSVVQLRIDAYGLAQDPGQTTRGLVAGAQERSGSGAIIDVDGYIVTNAHLISGARRIRVDLSHGRSSTRQAHAAPVDRGMLEARVVGMAPEFDLALLKVAVTGLPALRIAEPETLHHGQLVFSFGRSDDPRSSATPGMVSSLALQFDSDAPALYLQTDAPAGGETSGGLVVNVDGELVGVNAFTAAEQGGQPRQAFAIPGAVLAVVYPRLRADGRVHTRIPGMQVQAITPVLKAGLGLPALSGVIVSDISPGGPADRAGVKVQDVVQTVNGQLTHSVPAFTLSLVALGPEASITLGIRRGSGQFSLAVPTMALDAGRVPDLKGYEATRIAQLGIVATDLMASDAVLLPPLRIPSGVLVAARDQRSVDRELALKAGDVIHAVDGIAINGVNTLQGLLKGVAAGSPVVLQIERAGRLRFIAVEVF
jgi:serine protease Do